MAKVQDGDIDLTKLAENSNYHTTGATLHPKLEILEYPRNDIIYIRDIGQGAFGRVFQVGEKLIDRLLIGRQDIEGILHLHCKVSHKSLSELHQIATYQTFSICCRSPTGTSRAIDRKWRSFQNGVRHL